MRGRVLHEGLSPQASETKLLVEFTRSFLKDLSGYSITPHVSILSFGFGDETLPLLLSFSSGFWEGFLVAVFAGKMK
jgi:hypothetical protein